MIGNRKSASSLVSQTPTFCIPRGHPLDHHSSCVAYADIAACCLHHVGSLAHSGILTVIAQHLLKQTDDTSV
jgi:hypothetical protein